MYIYIYTYIVLYIMDILLINLTLSIIKINFINEDYKLNIIYILGIDEICKNDKRREWDIVIFVYIAIRYTYI